MRLRLGYPQDDAGLRLDTPIIAITTAHGAMGLVVDDVDDVEIIEEIADYENDESPYVNGVARLDERLLLLLDTAYLRSQIKVKDEARV
jgi:chemotaxis signal transduction protein